MDNLRLATIYTGNNCTGDALIIPVMPVNPELAEAYVPYQIYGKIFMPEEALQRGTAFPELVK